MFEQMISKIDPGSKLLRAWDLKGGISAQVTALEILLANGEKRKIIVRQHGEMDLKQNPRIAVDEFKLLNLLHSAGLPVPAPYYVDPSCELISKPYIVIEFIEGNIVSSPSNKFELISQLATHLANIHRVDIANFDFSFLPIQQAIHNRIPKEISESLYLDRIRNELEKAWPLNKNNDVLLHGDFWPGNILWKEGQLTAIIDWEDAAIGDPLSDLSNSRLEILWAFGQEAMNDFTQDYQREMISIDFANLPYWDLYAAVRPALNISKWGLDKSTEKMMKEKLKWFITQALKRL